jgi:hypothetical protein
MFMGYADHATQAQEITERDAEDRRNRVLKLSDPEFIQETLKTLLKEQQNSKNPNIARKLEIKLGDESMTVIVLPELPKFGGLAEIDGITFLSSASDDSIGSKLLTMSPGDSVTTKAGEVLILISREE